MVEVHARARKHDDPITHRIVIRNAKDIDADIVHGILYVLGQQGYLYHELYLNGEFESVSVTFPADTEDN